MSLYGIQGGAGRIGIRPEGQPGRASEGVRSAPQGRPSAPAAAPREGLTLEQATLPSEPPAGTDPALWSVLTGEERAFYARAQALGPLTYRPDAARPAQETMARGGRIDVRV